MYLFPLVCISHGEADTFLSAWFLIILNAVDVPFFLVTIASNSRASIRPLTDWELCQGDGQKVHSYHQVIVITFQNFYATLP